MKIKDLSGQRFGRLVAIEPAEKNKWGQYKWHCKCDCGNTRAIASSSLVQGRTLSCGCLHKEAVTKHGKSGTYTYRSWEAMMSRCYRENDKSFDRYGGVGIAVHEPWHDYENFLIDMGKRPDNTSIDRIDPKGNYEPGNCRWAASKTQGNNRRSSVEISASGMTMNITEWAIHLGINRSLIYSRIYSGQDPERVIMDLIASH